MKFEKINYHVIGHFSGWKRFQVATRAEVTGYTAEGLDGVAFRKRGGAWYVDHIASGLAVVIVGSATRKAAVNEYVNFHKEKLASIPAETMSKHIDQFNATPLESDVETWEELSYSSRYAWRIDKLTQAAKKGGAIVRRSSPDAESDAETVKFFGSPEALKPARDLLEDWDRRKAERDAEKAAEADETTTEKEEKTMKKNYFAGLETPAEINRVYKTLSAVFHPDNGGDLETMQELNRQRSAALAALEQGEVVPAVVQELPAATLYLPEKSETSTNLADALKALIEKAQTIPGVELELCGSWLWATGNTKPVKGDLKALGFRWSHNKAAWYWRDPSKPYFRRGGRKYSMDEIRDKYDSVKIA